jgi:hypothetical protein
MSRVFSRRVVDRVSVSLSCVSSRFVVRVVVFPLQLFWHTKTKTAKTGD